MYADWAEQCYIVTREIGKLDNTTMKYELVRKKFEKLMFEKAEFHAFNKEVTHTNTHIHTAPIHTHMRAHTHTHTH